MNYRKFKNPKIAVKLSKMPSLTKRSGFLTAAACAGNPKERAYRPIFCLRPSVSLTVHLSHIAFSNSTLKLGLISLSDTESDMGGARASFLESNYC